jgi:hypothetical protein
VSTPTAPTSRLVALCFDAGDPVALARFWATALRWDVDAGASAGGPGASGGEGVDLVPADGTGFRIRFLAAATPKAAKNRIHVDLTTASDDDRAETVRSLLAAGARPVDIGQGPDEDHEVLADPEGNELCVIAPGNSFLAGCPRLGSITCDGSPRTGRFWSAALGWPLVWDQDEETAIRAPDGTGPSITWGPPVVPKAARNRLHLHITPTHGDLAAEADRLLALGATRRAEGAPEPGRIPLADPDGNELCLVAPPHPGPRQ